MPPGVGAQTKAVVQGIDPSHSRLPGGPPVLVDPDWVTCNDGSRILDFWLLVQTGQVSWSVVFLQGFY